MGLRLSVGLVASILERLVGVGRHLERVVDGLLEESFD